MIIKAFKRIFNSDKMCRIYNDLNFGVTFLEHSVEHIIIPGSNVDSHVNEVHHIESWAKDDNLKLNHQKCVEIVFMDRISRNLTHCQFSIHRVIMPSGRLNELSHLRLCWSV